MLDSQDSAFSSQVATPNLDGLRYVRDDGPAIRRRKAGKGFVYFDSKGKRISDPTVLSRIKSLVIPPAWKDVWICPSAHGHIQATGRDARGRKQYRYHSAYRERREEAKYEHLLAFAEALPAIRATVAEHMSLRGLPRLKVVATVVHLLETTLIRVGNDEYAKQNESYGLTTLKAGGSESAAMAKRNLSAAVKRVAAALGNTPAVCRKSYIHPILCSAYLDGGLVLEAVAEEGGTSDLRPDEIALLALLRPSRSGASF